VRVTQNQPKFHYGDYTMNKITAVFAASALIASSTFAFAGGPVEIQDEPEPMVVIANPSSGSMGSLGGGGAVAAVVGVLLVGAALSGGSDSGSH
jgi:hypothetical protein